MPKFPSSRLRRNRSKAWLRRALREHHLSASDFILPLFICEDDSSISREIDNMDGVHRLTISEAVDMVARAEGCGISAIMLFPALPGNQRSKDASEAFNEKGLISRAISAISADIKSRNGDIGIITDIALDPYTIDGQDGLTRHGSVHNDTTVAALRRQAINYARAGADIVAPSDMMDGRVGAIRSALDSEGFHEVGIMSYSAKFCSSLYAPFRSAIGIDKSYATTIDKSDYQLDVTNGREAMREIAQDIDEGADTIIIKPSLLYLDVIKEACNTFNIPIIGYIVSGEYAMLRHAAKASMNNKIMIEACLCLKRSGASAIISYNALELASCINGNYMICSQ